MPGIFSTRMLSVLQPKSGELTMNCSRVNFGRHGLSWAQSNFLDDRLLHFDIFAIGVSGIRSIFPISLRLRSGISRAGIPATQLVFSNHLRDTIRHLVFQLWQRSGHGQLPLRNWGL